jgi:pyruvate-formate lyase-activating enzyme
MDPCRQIKEKYPVLGEFPRRITLELTNRCNLACVFCPRKLIEKERGDMNLDFARKVIDEMAEHAPLQIVPFFRGESLLHQHWDSILGLIKKRGLGEVQFTTNATRLGEYEAKRLLELDIDFISFSMDTLDPALYKRLRHGADYFSCLANVLHFLELRDTMGAKTQVQISAVETKDTRVGMDDFISYWQAKADRVRIYVMHSEDGNPGSISDSKHNPPKRRPCHKVFTDLVVYWDGTVGLCNHDWTRPKYGPSIGNLNTASISEIWNSEGFQGIRKKHLAGGIDDITPCRGCDHWIMYYLPQAHLGRIYSNVGEHHFSHTTHSSLPS